MSLQCTFRWLSVPPPPPPMAQQPLVGQGLLIKASRLHSDTTRIVGLLWVRDQPVPAASTCQHTKFKRDRDPRLRPDSNLQSQQAKGRTARP
jgi:hypothetical protein